MEGAGPLSPGQKGRVEACLSSRAGGLWPALPAQGRPCVLGQALEGRPRASFCKGLSSKRGQTANGPGERRSAHWLRSGIWTWAVGARCLAARLPAWQGPSRQLSVGRMSRGTGWAGRSSEASRPSPGRQQGAGTALNAGTPGRGKGWAGLLLGAHSQAGAAGLCMDVPLARLQRSGGRTCLIYFVTFLMKL